MENLHTGTGLSAPVMIQASWVFGKRAQRKHVRQYGLLFLFGDIEGRLAVCRSYLGIAESLQFPGGPSLLRIIQKL